MGEDIPEKKKEEEEEKDKNEPEHDDHDNEAEDDAEDDADGDDEDEEKSEKKSDSEAQAPSPNSDDKAPSKKTKEEEEARKKKYANWPMRDIKEPHQNDVMYGRGGGTNHHPGNKIYRKTVEDRKLDYVNSKRLDKPLVALGIIREWRAQSPPGRFLKLDEKTGLWHDVGDKKAREKTSQALREKAPEIRKKQEEEAMIKAGKVRLHSYSKMVSFRSKMLLISVFFDANRIHPMPRTQTRKRKRLVLLRGQKISTEMKLSMQF